MNKSNFGYIEQNQWIKESFDLNETILLVEDDFFIRDTQERILKNIGGYNVITASNWIEALSEYISNKDIIDLVILDLSMPIMWWEKVLKKILEIKNDVKVIISSGYSDLDIKDKDWILSNAKGFINKPVELKILLDKVKTVLSNWL